MNIKKWTLLVAMMGVLLATAFASNPYIDEYDYSEEFKKRREYFKENIKPKVDAQRLILEKSITDADKKEINRIREEMISQRLLHNELLFQARANRIKGEEVSDDLITEIRAQRISIENLMDDAKVIANRYRPEIDDLLGELKENREEWRKEMGHKKGEGREGNKGRRSQNHKGHHRGPRSHGFAPFGQGQFGMVTFLLWDTERG